MADRKLKLAAIMLTDIVGFSKKMGDDEEKALKMLKRGPETSAAGHATKRPFRSDAISPSSAVSSSASGNSIN